MDDTSKDVNNEPLNGDKNHPQEEEIEVVPEKAVIEKEESMDEIDNSVLEEEGSRQAVKKLKEKIKALEDEKAEYLTGWQRTKAEFINARKRDEEEKKEFIRYSNENLISELLPVLSSFDMAMANKESWEKVDKNWRLGVEYIYNQLKKTLSDFGLKEIYPVGQKLDLNMHEAVSYEQVMTPEEDHVILKVVEKGFSINDKVLKAPKVVVGEYKK